MRVDHRAAVAVLAACLAADLAAQDSKNPARTGRRTPLPRAQEVALARSAAPASVSDSATIWVFTDSGYVVAATGSNGVACYVSRSWPQSLEPHCFDAEGAATILRIHMKEVELLHRGTTVTETDRVVGEQLASGALRLPRRPAMSYMMSGGQHLINDNGRPIGNWRPHIMIYYPYLEATDLYRGATDMAAGTVAGAGSATSSIVFLAADFVRVKPSP